MKVHAITLAFNRPEIIRKSIEQFYTTATRWRGEHKEDFHHWVVDNHYPLPNKDENSKLLRELCVQYRMNYIDPGKNLGLHRGFNWACDRASVAAEDVVIGYDPDSWPLTMGWDDALVVGTIMDPTTVWGSLMNPISWGEMQVRGNTRRLHGGLHVREIHAPVVNSICAWKGWWLKRAGGIQEPTEFYGGLECCMWPHVRQAGFRWVFLEDYHEGQAFRAEQDEMYKLYKWAHAHEGWRGDFDAFLRLKGIAF